MENDVKEGKKVFCAVWRQFKCPLVLLEDILLNFKCLRMGSNIGLVGVIVNCSLFYSITLKDITVPDLPASVCILLTFMRFPHLWVMIRVLVRIL